MLPVAMEVALSSLIQHELLVFKQFERLTYDLERRPDFTPLAVYRCVDRADDGRIDNVNLDQFFRKNGLYYQDSELIALIRRIDTTADQTISHQEMTDFLQEQIGFRSTITSKSIMKATPVARAAKHKDILFAQEVSVK
jgi:hypothetical protein